MQTRTPLADEVDLEALSVAELLELRASLREQVSRLFSDKAKIAGQLRAVTAGEAWPDTPDEATLRRARRQINLAITDESALLDQVKLRLFALQAPPRPRVPPDAEQGSQQTTAEERAARLAALDQAGPDALLLRLAQVVHVLIEAAGSEVLTQADRRMLGDVAFYLRQKFGKGAQHRG